ncbi:MAG: hypothetical protein LUC18_03045 [Porphyromonadaceae bacterium]|nr:hypothetical protein [Porphyromonadaceae bacterium]
MIHVFIESSKEKGNEAQFVNTYVKHLSKGTVNVDVVPVKGRENLKNFTSKIQEFTDQGDTVLVIFDCDSPPRGGFFNRTQEMEDFKKKIGIDFDYFFFPDNKSDGEFEDLLIKIINPKHGDLMRCFDCYENCLSNLPFKSCYELPDSKKRIYDYIASFKRSNSQRDAFKNEHDWGFDNPEYWNLDSPALDPLKSFLSKHLER